MAKLSKKINDLIQYMKQRGYIFSKDNLGIYFSNANRRISLMDCGPARNCFVNNLSSGVWHTVAAEYNIINEDILVQWVKQICLQ